MIAEFAAVTVTLLVLHDLADHVTGQTDFHAENKVKMPKQCLEEGKSKFFGLYALAGHVFWYHLTLVFGLIAVSGFMGITFSWLGLAAGMLFSAVTHAVLDTRVPVRLLLEETGSPNFAKMLTPVCGMYQADQALHRSCLLVASMLIVGL